MGDFIWNAEDPGHPGGSRGTAKGGLAMVREPRGQLWQLLVPDGNHDAYDAIEAALGARPQVNRVVVGRGALDAAVSIIWMRIDQFFVNTTAEEMNAAAESLSRYVYLLDQGDGRSVFRLDGAAEPMREALSHLLPLDLRPTSFPAGHAAASEIDLMPVNIWCKPTSTDENHIVYLSVFRSYADSLQRVLTETGFSIR